MQFIYELTTYAFWIMWLCAWIYVLINRKKEKEIEENIIALVLISEWVHACNTNYKTIIIEVQPMNHKTIQDTEL